jgi:hypothetical protein
MELERYGLNQSGLMKIVIKKFAKNAMVKGLNNTMGCIMDKKTLDKLVKKYGNMTIAELIKKM